MPRALPLFLVTLLCGAVSLSAQNNMLFLEMSYPHYAEAVRLGGQYVAVGRGAAAAHVNSAALAFQPEVQVLFSSGRSAPFPGVEYDMASDVVVSAPIPGWNTTVGVGYLIDDFTTSFKSYDDGLYVYDIRNTRLSVHTATALLEGLALGLAAHRYDSRIRPSWRSDYEATADAWDASLSVHARMTASFIGRERDELRFGLTFDNIFASDIRYIDEAQAEPIHQVFRLGASYFWNPRYDRVWDLDPFAALLTLEGSLHGRDHEYRTWSQYGIGGEIRLFEILMLSAGWENLEWQAYSYNDPGLPALRWGFGLDLPLHRLWSGGMPVHLQLDFARTEWYADTDNAYEWRYSDRSSVDDPVWSLQLRAPLY
ncbi:MAG: hypothetical protein KFF77_09950 [Bacteroidetes bacterium]|nr:hypothetical protein [Bacteroidota bacterium]